MSFVDCSCGGEVSDGQWGRWVEWEEAHIVALFGLPQADVLGGHAQNVALAIDDTCASTTGADIDANVVVHLWVQLVMGVRGHLTGRLPVRLSKREGRHYFGKAALASAAEVQGGV